MWHLVEIQRLYRCALVVCPHQNPAAPFRPLTLLQFRLLWCSFSDAISPDNLNIATMGHKNVVDSKLLHGHGFQVSSGAPGMFSRIDDASKVHLALYVLRVWTNDTIEPLHNTTIPQAVLERSAGWMRQSRPRLPLTTKFLNC